MKETADIELLREVTTEIVDPDSLYSKIISLYNANT